MDLLLIIALILTQAIMDISMVFICVCILSLGFTIPALSFGQYILMGAAYGFTRAYMHFSIK